MSQAIIQTDNLSLTSPMSSFSQTFFEYGFGMPNVQAGHALVVFIGGSTGGSTSPVESITDNYGNTYVQVPGAYTTHPAYSSYWQDVWVAYDVAQVNDNGTGAPGHAVLDLTFNFSSSVAVAIVMAECSGINGATLVVGGNGVYQSPNAPLDGPSVNGGSGALYLASLCSFYASSGDEYNSTPAAVNSPWALPPQSGPGTGGSGFPWSGAEGPTVAGLVSSGSQQPIFNTTAIGSSFDVGTIVAIAFIPAAPPSNGVFLGSVRIAGEAPSGVPSPFLGTVKVVGSVPAGAKNPYLGNVTVVSSAPSGSSNPTIGEVVIVEDAPISSDPYLGEIVESS
jgi:hypothetical protein